MFALYVLSNRSYNYISIKHLIFVLGNIRLDLNFVYNYACFSLIESTKKLYNVNLHYKLQIIPKIDPI